MSHKACHLFQWKGQKDINTILNSAREVNEWICLVDTCFLYTAANRHSAVYWKWAKRNVYRKRCVDDVSGTMLTFLHIWYSRETIIMPLMVMVMVIWVWRFWNAIDVINRVTSRVDWGLIAFQILKWGGVELTVEKLNSSLRAHLLISRKC